MQEANARVFQGKTIRHCKAELAQSRFNKENERFNRVIEALGINKKSSYSDCSEQED